MAKDWNADFVARAKCLKSRNEQQELIVLLFEKRSRTKDEERELELLLKAERAKERAKSAELAAVKLLGSRKDAERKARNHRLIQLGLLVDIAGLEGRSRGEILGGLLALAIVKGDKWVEWKRSGDVLLAENNAGNI